MTKLIAHRAHSLRGSVKVPGDKSISHRSLLLGALSQGTSNIEGFVPCGDCFATLACLRDLGIDIDRRAETSLSIRGNGLKGFVQPTRPLDCRRSGTTMRLLAGILAGQDFGCVLTGDQQLLLRPMKRIADPLTQMGASIITTDGYAPITIRKASLRGMKHDLPIASAQVKSAILLAGLYADDETIVQQPGPARDHTERMLEAMGANLHIEGLTVSLQPASRLEPLNIQVPGDISSAAYPIIAALLVPDSEIIVQGVGVNPTRTGLLDVLGQMGAELEIVNTRDESNEPVADISVRSNQLRGTEVDGDTVVRMIDEFPILAVAATQAEGITTVRGARELRVKETDRIATTVAELRKLGARIEPLSDGFVVEGPTQLHGNLTDSHGDHRLAMALAIAGLLSEGDVTIEESHCIQDSFPGFARLMTDLGAEYD